MTSPGSGGDLLADLVNRTVVEDVADDVAVS